MANSIPRDFIDRLVSDSDIVSVLGAYLDLQKKGNNYVCRCPFHEEKTGSFTVSPQKSIYHCCLLYTSPSPRDRYISRMPSSA